uniref:hypothetical protein n=1 Tax=Salmonella sp. TaxID=599 RepID=UPI001CD923E5|nr:hypothetical protein [Salmonella sp.]
MAKEYPFSSAFYWMMKGLDAGGHHMTQRAIYRCSVAALAAKKALRILAGRGIRYCGKVRCDVVMPRTFGNDEW